MSRGVGIRTTLAKRSSALSKPRGRHSRNDERPDLKFLHGGSKMFRFLAVRARPAAAAAGLVAALAFLTSGAGAATLVAYNVYPLVSDGGGSTAPLADTALVNGWGLSATATSPWWVA